MTTQALDRENDQPQDHEDHDVSTDLSREEQQTGDYPGLTDNLHHSSQTALGHATVLDTDGSALNRFTYQYLVEKKREPDALKESKEYQVIQQRVANAHNKIAELGENPDEQALTKAQKEKEEALQARQEFLTNYFQEKPVTLSDEEKAELRQHLNEQLAQKYPNNIQPQKGENGVDVFKNASGEFHSKTREDGKYELSTNDTNFSGVVRVPRVDAKGNELNDCDIIEYHEGKPVSIVAGREGQTNIHEFDKLLQTNKAENRGVTVASSLEQQEAPTTATRSQQQPPPPTQDVRWRSAPLTLPRPPERRQDVRVVGYEAVAATTLDHARIERGSAVPGNQTPPTTPGKGEQQQRRASVTHSSGL